MSKKTKSDPPESSPQSQSDPELSPESSGAFEAASESEPIAPILKQAIEHIKKSNTYQKQASIDLIKQNVLLQDQNKTLRFVLVVMLLGVLSALWLGYRMEHVVHEGEAVAVTMVKLGEQLAGLEKDMRENVAKKEDVEAAVEKVREDADDKLHPELVSDGDGMIKIRIPVRAESTSHPSAMVSPPPPVAVEIPVQLPKGLDLKVKKRSKKKPKK